MLCDAINKVEVKGQEYACLKWNFRNYRTILKDDNILFIDGGTGYDISTRDKRRFNPFLIYYYQKSTLSEWQKPISQIYRYFRWPQALGYLYSVWDGIPQSHYLCKALC